MHSEDSLTLAIERLRMGGLVAFPTETVYGLGADALEAAAVERVFAAKGRPARNPLIVHVCDVAMAQRVTKVWPEAASRLAERFWPGPLSIVLPKAGVVPGVVTGGGPNVAVRCPDHLVTVELIRRFGKPLVGPSANKSGGVSPTTAEHVREAFGPSEVMVIDGGVCERGIESTVVSLAGDSPVVLRPGLISPDEIAEVLNVAVGCLVQTSASVFDSSACLESPGLLSRHYAPATPTVMLRSEELEAALGSLVSPAVVMAIGGKVPAPHIRIQMSKVAVEYAADLYSALRNADAAKRAMIVVEAPPSGTVGRADRWIWMAIHDRLRRACCSG